MNQNLRITFLIASILCFQNAFAQEVPATATEKKSLMKPKLPDVSSLAKTANQTAKDSLKKAASKPVIAKESVLKNAISKAQTHEVKPKETIYSISKMYGVSIPEIQKANNMTDYSLKIGQKLIIKKTIDSTIKKVQNLPAIPVKKPYIPEGTTINRIYENGIAKVIEGKIRSKKLMALHRFAPIGSIIQVKNKANKNYLSAKVIGKLPPSTDEKVVIRLSPLAYDILDAKDTQCAVEVSFISAKKPKIKKSAEVVKTNIQVNNTLPVINLPVK